MSAIVSHGRRLLRCKKGVTAIEFALLAPVFFLLLFGIVEFSLIMFSSAAIESATQQGARMGKTGFLDTSAKDDNGQTMERKAWIRDNIKKSLGGMINEQSLQIDTQVMPTMQTAPNPDNPGSPTGTLGQGGQVVLYTVTYNWPVQTPLLKHVLSGNTQDGFYKITSTVMVQNEPFGTAPE